MKNKTAQGDLRSASLRRHDPYRFEGTLSATRNRYGTPNVSSQVTGIAVFGKNLDVHRACAVEHRKEISLRQLPASGKDWKNRSLLWKTGADCCLRASADKVIPAAAKAGWRPHGDSNPGTYRERVVSWASRRWGPGKISFRRAGGGTRDRTADLLHAMQALSQLSYTPLERSADYRVQERSCKAGGTPFALTTVPKSTQSLSPAMP
jgi:hypothetical protein